MTVAASTLGRLRSTYRCLGSRARGRELSERLDRIARWYLPAQLAAALADVVDRAAAVHVLERVRARTVLTLAPGLSDNEIARRWAASLARAVRKALNDEHNASGRPLEFRDSGEFLARFLVDAMAGNARSRWYFAPLSQLAGPTLSATVRALATHFRDELEGALVELLRARQLDAFLGRLDDEVLNYLWRGQDTAAAASDAGIFFDLAWRLTRELMGRDRQRRPPAALRRRFRLPRGAADWSDRTDLADAVADATELLVREGEAELPAGRGELDRGLRRVLAEGWDWLDRGRLSARLHRLRGGISKPAAKASPAPSLEPRPGSPTPRQRAVLDDLRDILSAGQVRMAVDPPRPRDIAIRLYHALAAERPRWRSSRMARRMVEQVVAAWERGRPLPGLSLSASWHGSNGSTSRHPRGDESPRSEGRRINPAWEGESTRSPGLRPERTDVGSSGLPSRAREGASVADQPAVDRSTGGHHAAASKLPYEHPTSGPRSWHGPNGSTSRHPRGESPRSEGRRINPAWEGESTRSPGLRPERTDVGSPGLQSRAREGAQAAAGSSMWKAGQDPADRPQGDRAATDPATVDRETLATPANGELEGSTRPARQEAAVISSECAGVFLLLRAAIDQRLAAFTRESAFPVKAGDPWPAALLALAVAWAGPPAFRDGLLDPGLAWLGGVEGSRDLTSLKKLWRPAGAAGRRTFQDRLAGLALARRAVRPEDRFSVHAAGELVVACAGGVALFCETRPAASRLQRRLAAWSERWRRLGGEAEIVRVDGELAGSPGELLRWGPEGWLGQGEEGESVEHRTVGERVVDDLATLAAGLFLPSVPGAALSLAAGLTLRGWASWLRGFDTASPAFLLEHMIRRPGVLRISESEVAVELAPGAIDVVLEIASYFDRVDEVEWLEGRRVSFVRA